MSEVVHTAIDPGVEGNERLTVLAGSLLIVLLAVLGVTIVWIGRLLWLHLFVGLALLGPVALKLASVGYRFARYYTHNRAYRRRGPPPAAHRALGPVVVLSTLVVFITGVVLLLDPASRSPVLLLHKASFVIWLGCTALHVLGHLPRVMQVIMNGQRVRHEIFALHAASASANPGHGRTASPGTASRAGRAHTAALTASLLVGLTAAVALLGQFPAWTH
ncbi:MAG: hypothetical protein ACRDKL_11300 [Solirubrobacteraceae bacterium]